VYVGIFASVSFSYKPKFKKKKQYETANTFFVNTFRVTLSGQLETQQMEK